MANHTVTILSQDEAFQLRVRHENETVDTVPIPSQGESVVIGGIEVANREDTLYVYHDGTVVAIASFDG